LLRLWLGRWSVGASRAELVSLGETVELVTGNAAPLSGAGRLS
jgi:hypothetical protein